MLRNRRRMIKYQETLEINDMEIVPEAPSYLSLRHEDDDEYLACISIDSCVGSTEAVLLSRVDCERMYRWLGIVLEE